MLMYPDHLQKSVFNSQSSSLLPLCVNGIHWWAIGFPSQRTSNVFACHVILIVKASNWPIFVTNTYHLVPFQRCAMFDDDSWGILSCSPPLLHLWGFFWETRKRSWLTFSVRGPSYVGLIWSISWLLMCWLLASAGHQQPLYWLSEISKSWSFMRKDFHYLCHDTHVDVEEWHESEKRVIVFVSCEKCIM